MTASSPDACDDPDMVDTLPASEVAKLSTAPASADGWDSEAPTAVHSRRPLFAGPPRLPTT